MATLVLLGVTTVTARDFVPKKDESTFIIKQVQCLCESVLACKFNRRISLTVASLLLATAAIFSVFGILFFIFLMRQQFAEHYLNESLKSEKNLGNTDKSHTIWETFKTIWVEVFSIWLILFSWVGHIFESTITV